MSLVLIELLSSNIFVDLGRSLQCYSILVHWFIDGLYLWQVWPCCTWNFHTLLMELGLNPQKLQHDSRPAHTINRNEEPLDQLAVRCWVDEPAVSWPNVSWYPSLWPWFSGVSWLIASHSPILLVARLLGRWTSILRQLYNCRCRKK